MSLNRWSMRNLVVHTVKVLVWLSLANPVWAQLSLYYDMPGNLIAQTSQTTGPPIILRPPVAQVVSAGNDLSFSVVVADTRSVTYQWRFNSTNITDATSDALRLTNVSAASQGNYDVIVANPSGSVTSAPAMLWWDSVGDGLPDSWKIQYFGSITNATARGDPLHDGVSNLEKFYEGINPTNGVGLHPRLFVNGLNGYISVLPDLNQFALGQSVTLTPIPSPGFQFVGWSGDLAGADNPATLTMDSSKNITAVFGLPLGYVVDATNLVWTTGGNVGWFGQTYVSHDGVAAAQTGPIATNQESWMETTVYMSSPGTVSFWWKIVSDRSAVTFSVNGVAQKGAISPSSDWAQIIYYLPEGTDVLRWTYNKSDSEKSGFDAAWVDQVVVAVYPDPLLDTDNDGLPDLWEYRYFGDLHYDGTDDPDGDGVNNHDEYLDGTDPTDPTSVFPRLMVAESGGTVAISPALAKYSYLQPVTLSAVPNAGFTFTGWSGGLDGISNPATLTMDQSKSVRAMFAMSSVDSLAKALDATNLSWSTGGHAPWFGQSYITHDGLDAAQSGAITGTNQQSWLRTTVIGPGPLSFWWKVLSGSDLEFTIDSAVRTNISGNLDWQQQTYDIPAGSHVLQWTSTNGPSGGVASDAGWVDQVSFGADVPMLVALPTDQTVFQGADVTFSAAATSGATLSYRWQKNGVDLVDGGSTSGTATATLSLHNVQTNDTGTYSVAVSTPSGGASSAATLTVIDLVSLAEALDTPGRVWNSGGDANWFGQTSISHDGSDAAQSGAIISGQESWLETTLSGPGLLTFWWKVSCESGQDYLNFLTGGVTNASLSGEVDWVPRSFILPAGAQTVRWSYVQNGSSATAAETAWLDQVAFVPGFPPAITTQPQSQSVLAGTNVSFSLGVTGSTPLSYQWFFNRTNSVGLNNGTLTLNNVQTSDGGDYSVVVSNALGTETSASAFLTVTPFGFQPTVSLSVSNDVVSITWSAVPGLTYQVQYKNDLDAASWSNLSPVINATGPLAGTTDNLGDSQRFYRVRSP
jgi:Immunoglobulin domain/Divergent InlB B-repeat domain/Immunoglobulin I-set domain